MEEQIKELSAEVTRKLDNFAMMFYVQGLWKIVKSMSVGGKDSPFFIHREGEALWYISVNGKRTDVAKLSLEELRDISTRIMSSYKKWKWFFSIP